MAKNIYSSFYEIPSGKATGSLTHACLVLEGGALRGLYTAGVLDYLMLSNINIDCVIGTSAGGLVGVNYVSRNIGRCARLNLAFRFDNRFIGLPALIKNKGVFGFDFIFNQYNNIEPLDLDSFNDPNRRLIVTCTNCNTGQVEYFEKGKDDNFFDAAKASASMPFLSKMVDVNGQPYLDGGCACKIPYKWAIEQGYEKIIVVRTREKEYRKKIKDTTRQTNLFYHKYPEFAKSVSSMNEEYNLQCDELEQLEKDGRILVLSPKQRVMISRMESNIEKLGELYKSGYQDCQRNIEQIKDYLNK